MPPAPCLSPVPSSGWAGRPCTPLNRQTLACGWVIGRPRLGRLHARLEPLTTRTAWTGPAPLNFSRWRLDLQPGQQKADEYSYASPHDPESSAADRTPGSRRSGVRRRGLCDQVQKLFWTGRGDGLVQVLPGRFLGRHQRRRRPVPHGAVGTPCGAGVGPKWEDGTFEVKYRDLTQISFGGDYEKALWATVGGLAA